MIYPDYFIAAGYEYADIEHFIAAPFFRKKFTATKTARAEIVIGAAGFYRLLINGKDITKGELAPYISNPDDIVYYDRYDVSDYINEGENVVAVLLGNGFQNNPGGAIWDFQKAPWRGAPKFAMRLSLVAEDGSEKKLESDESFKVCDSPILFDDYRCGEYYDARLELDDFHSVDFDDSELRNAIKAECPKGEKRLCAADPVRFYKELKPVSVISQENGWLYDFGENNTGVCRLSVNAEAGQKIILRYGEWLKEGVFTRENISFAKQSDMQKDFVQKSEYICKDGKQTHIPSFIYNGFRYVYVEGITEEQATEDLLTYMCLRSDFSECGNFSCSDETVNKLQEITRRSDRSCFVYFPNDCPQREKNGWTADAALSCEHTLLNFKPEKSYIEWLRNIVYAQNEAGAFPGIVPTGGWGFSWGNGPAWDQVLLELPYRIYQYRGTTEAIEICAPAIYRYILYINSRRDTDGLIAIGLGDWCHIGYNGSKQAPLILTDSIISMEIFRKAAFMLKVIGDQKAYKTAENLYGSMRESIRNKLIDFSTMTAFGNCQTSQAMAIFYGVFDESEKSAALKVLLNQITAADNHMDVGVLGGRILFHVLSENGEADLAYEMITRPDFPSYGNWIKRGATTLWEDFPVEGGYVHSLNHHFWGDISHWFISAIAGICVNPNADDITYFEVKPNFVEKLQNASAWHDAPCGKISVSWERTGENTVELAIEASKAMHGKIVLPEGYKFADGSTSKILTSGNFSLSAS